MFTPFQSRVRGDQSQRGAVKAGGFTFIEVMICTVIMLVLFVSFYTAITAGSVIIADARAKLRATQILLNRVEGIRLFTWNQLTDTSLLPTTFTEYYYPNATNGNFGTVYSGTVSVTPAVVTVDPANLLSGPTSYSTNLYQVTISLNWSTVKGTRSASMTTYAARYGVQNYIWSSN